MQKLCERKKPLTDAKWSDIIDNRSGMDYHYNWHPIDQRFERNYRNDFAFAIAIHQLKGMIDNKNFIPSPMFMLPHEQDILEFDDTGVLFKYDKKIGILQETDVHILDKEFVNV